MTFEAYPAKKRKRMIGPLRGFTLVEVLMTVVIFAVLFGVCFTILLSGSDSWQVNSTQMQLQQNLRRAMNWIKEDLIEAGQSTITNVPANGSWYNTITFSVPSGVSGNAITWASPSIQFLLGGASSNELQRTSGTTKTVAQYIQSLQFRRQATSPTIVEVSLQAQKNSVKGTPVTMTKSFKVKLRN